MGAGVELSRKRAEQVAAADRAAMTAFRDMTPNPAARLLSFGVRRRRRTAMDALQRITQIRRDHPKLGWSREVFLRMGAEGKRRWRETEQAYGIQYTIFGDVVAQITPSFRLPAEKESAALQADIPVLRNVTSRIAVWFVKWECCPATKGLPNPYEPWVEIWEHGGGFSVEHGWFVDVYDHELMPVGAVIARREENAEQVAAADRPRE
jgi:hypothetical protein